MCLERTHGKVCFISDNDQDISVNKSMIIGRLELNLPAEWNPQKKVGG